MSEPEQINIMSIPPLLEPEAFYGIFATEEAARKYGGYRSDQSDFDSFYNKYDLEHEYESSVADPDAPSSEVDDEPIWDTEDSE